MIDEHWFEISKETLERFGATVEDPRNEGRYQSQPDWEEIADNLRPYLLEGVKLDKVSETSKNIIESWLSGPPTASILFTGNPETKQPWNVTNGRHRLTGLMSVRPTLKIPVYWQGFGSVGGPYSEQVCASKLARFELQEQKTHSFLPKTDQNKKFLEALQDLAEAKFRKPAPDWPSSKIDIAGRDADLSFRSDTETYSAFVWFRNQSALIVLNSVRVLFHDGFQGEWKEITRNLPQLASIVANKSRVTVISEVMTGIHSDIHFTELDVNSGFDSVLEWGPPIQDGICRAGVRLRRSALYLSE